MGEQPGEVTSGYALVGASAGRKGFSAKMFLEPVLSLRSFQLYGGAQKGVAKADTQLAKVRRWKDDRLFGNGSP